MSKKIITDKEGIQELIDSEDVITSIEFVNKFSDEKGQYTSIFYFRLEKEVGVSKDGISPAYSKQTLEHNAPLDHDLITEEIREDMATVSGVDKKYIVPITKEQYEEEMGVYEDE
jgi:hypothetical protein